MYAADELLQLLDVLGVSFLDRLLQPCLEFFPKSEINKENDDFFCFRLYFWGRLGSRLCVARPEISVLVLNG